MKAGMLLIFVTHLMRFYSGAAPNRGAGSAYSNDSLPRIIIVNAFSAATADVRKNKRELLAELADSLQVYLAAKIKVQIGGEPVIIAGMSNNITDSNIISLMKDKQATKAIIILSLDAYFIETGEKRVEEYGSDPKIKTSYDICAAGRYDIYDISGKLHELKKTSCKYFTSRSMKEKGFAIKFGPDIVAKKKYTYGIVETNAQEFLDENGSSLQ